MIILSDGTEWHFEDLLKDNKRLSDAIKKNKTIKKRNDEFNRLETLYFDREKVHEVGKPLKDEELRNKY